jgi:hypothetical protein
MQVMACRLGKARKGSATQHARSSEQEENRFVASFRESRLRYNSIELLFVRRPLLDRAEIEHFGERSPEQAVSSSPRPPFTPLSIQQTVHLASASAKSKAGFEKCWPLAG